MNRKDTAVLGVATLIALAVVNFVAARHFFRVDLTQSHQYTLAPATKDLLRGLDDIVTIRVYFTRQLPPALLPLKTAVDDVLADFRGYGGSRVQIEYPDPQASPQAEQEIQILGIQPVQLNVVAKDKREVARVYLGMAIFHGDRKHIIPALDRTDNLEYELAAGILKVTQDRPPTIGWWGPVKTTTTGGRDESAGAGQYETVRRRLQQRYTMRDVSPDGSNVSAKDLQALIIIAPKEFSQGQQLVVDQYLAAGGHVFALIDRMDVDSNTLTAKPVTTGLEELLGVYGVTINPDLVADASSGFAAFSSSNVTIYRQYPFWPVLHRLNFDQTNPIVSRLEQITLPWVSSIDLAGSPPEGLTATVLVRSSRQSGVTSGEPPITAHPDAATDLISPVASKERPLAVLMNGKFASAFASGKLPLQKGAEAKEQGVDGGQLLVLGTARIIEDRSARQFSDGVVFFENAVDYLALGESLIGIRSRAVISRPITALSDPAKAAVKYANTFGVPAMVVVGGLVGMAWRRAKRRALQMVFK